jgi:hypothetical protein
MFAVLQKVDRRRLLQLCALLPRGVGSSLYRVVILVVAQPVAVEVAR